MLAGASLEGTVNQGLVIRPILVHVHVYVGMVARSSGRLVWVYLHM